jgi:hypothetical protein
MEVKYRKRDFIYHKAYKMTSLYCVDCNIYLLKINLLASIAFIVVNLAFLPDLPKKYILIYLIHKMV